MKKIRIAQIGTSKNSHGNFIWNTLIRRSDVYEIVGYHFPENEREKFPSRAKAFDGYLELTLDQILSDPEIDAVAIETEEIYLTKYALMAAEAGKHIHMEKPGGRELADFERLVALAKEKGLVFSLGYMYRFNPEISSAVEKARSGELGKIISVEAQMNCRHPDPLRRWLGAFPGGMLFFLGCHMIDLIYRIQGEPLEVIPLSTSSGLGGVNTEDFGMAVYKYDGGVSFAKASDVEVGGFLRRQLVISGEKGTIEINPLEELTDGPGYDQYTYTTESYDSNNWHEPREIKKSECYDRYEAMMLNFADLVHGKENPYTYDYELGLYKLILRSCGEEI